MRRGAVWTLISISLWMIIFCAIDQSVKCLIECRCLINESYDVIPHFFSICYVLNTGASWGMLQNSSQFLAALGILTLFFAYVYGLKIDLSRLSSRIIFACALGGILGNTIDRMCREGVVDFLDFYIGQWHWPCFNLADIFICSSCIFYLLMCRRKR